MTDGSDALEEIKAMKTVAEALEKLDDAAVSRVLRWAVDRFGVSGRRGKDAGRLAGSEDEDRDDDKADSARFGQLADLYAAAGPSIDAEKALVVGYWYQKVKGDADFDSQRVNTELKNLGHGVGNITRAFEQLKGQRPQLAIQTKKSGTTQQARKRFKLTQEGLKAVEKMLRSNGTTETDGS